MLSSMFKASAVIELRFFSKGDVWSFVINFFLAVLGTYSIRQKFSYISLVYRKYPFIMELILMKNINKTPKKMENVNGKEKWDKVRQEKIRFQKMISHSTDLRFCKNKVTNCLFRCLGQKKYSCFRKSAWGKAFYHSPTRIVKCVSEYIFKIKTTTTKKQQQQEDKKQKKLKKKREYLWKI